MSKRRTALLLALILALAACGACGEAAFRGYSKQDGYQYVIFGNYPYDRDGTVKPLMWKVLSVTDDGLALLITNQVIDAYPMQYIEGKVDLKTYKGYRKISSYEESDLYPWMNSEMLTTMLTEEEQAVLDDSRGKLFLLTRQEFLMPEYGFSTAVYGTLIKSRVCKCTGYASKRGVYS